MSRASKWLRELVGGVLALIGAGLLTWSAVLMYYLAVGRVEVGADYPPAGVAAVLLVIGIFVTFAGYKLSNPAAAKSGSDITSRKSESTGRPTKRRNLMIFFGALLALAYVFRHELIFIARDKGSLLAFDAEYDKYLVATDKVQPLASAIQDECARAGSCPETPAGWTRHTDGFASVAGDLLYVPIRSGRLSDDKGANTFQNFEITYDYSPGWQLFAYGGVGTDLTLERKKRDPGAE